MITSVNRTRDLPVCSAVPQPTAPPRAPVLVCVQLIMYVIVLKGSQIFRERMSHLQILTSEEQHEPSSVLTTERSEDLCLVHIKWRSVYINKEDSQCTCNMEARSHTNCCCGKNNKSYTFWTCVYSLRYPACNARAPYCQLWPVPLYSSFTLCLIKGKILEKIFLNTKCVFWFSLQLLSEAFLVLRRTERYMMKSVHWSSCKVPVILIGF